MNSSRESPLKQTSNLFKMASKAKKLSVMKIRKIFVSGKALREEAVLERVSGELAGISKVYLDSCNREFESIFYVVALCRRP